LYVKDGPPICDGPPGDEPTGCDGPSME